MRLKTVRLHPFGRILDMSWDISMPLAIIAGPNEVGKTTLRQAIFHVLFTPSRLTPAKLRDTMEHWFPLPAGDHANVTMTFEHAEREWTLVKRWGVAEATQLTASGTPPIADPQAVAKRLADMLGSSEATFKHVLFTGHTELEQTIASLLKNAKELRDVRDLLRAGSAGTGEVDEQRLRRVLDEKIKISFSYWDEERGRPQRQNGQEKGVRDKWSKGVGEILKAWYTWQDLIAEREDIVRIEADIDRLTSEHATLDEKDRCARELLDSYGALRGPLAERAVLEERVPRLQQELKILQGVFTDWPIAAAAVEAWETQRTELDERDKALKLELNTARRRENAVAIAQSFNSLLQAQEDSSRAAEAEQKQPHPDAASLATINLLDEAILSAKNQLAARTLAWRVEVTDPRTITVTGGVEPAEAMEVGVEGAKGIAAGRVQIDVGGITLTVNGGDDDVDAIMSGLQRNSEKLVGILASCGAETVEAARELDMNHKRLFSEAAIKRRTFEHLLRGKSFDEWQREAEEANALPQTRDVPTIDEEIKALSGRIQKASLKASDNASKIRQWKSEYADLDSLGEQLLNKKSELRKENETLALAPDVPLGFSSAQHLVNDLNTAQDRLNESREHREKIKGELTRREVELGDRRSEDLREKAEVAEKVFNRVVTKGQALQRIRDTLNRVTAGGDDILKEFAGHVEHIFSQVTRDAAKLEFNGSLPAYVQRGTVKLEPTRLSQGAGGALALAIRLAMAEAHLKESGGFIMLDDPLVHFDASRAAEAADIIRAFSERHQVIFFTCHKHHVEQLNTK
jgi:hypothetical protein